MWYIYILLCEDNSLYTGFSTNVEARLLVHQSGKGAKYTRSHKPVSIIHIEAFQTKIAALKREREVKSWSRKEKIEKLKLNIPLNYPLAKT